MVATMIISKQAATESGGLTAKAFGVAEKLRSGTQGFVGRNTFGRVGARLESEMDKRGIGSSRIGQFTRSYTTGALAGAKFGGGTSRKDIIGKEEGREKEREGRTRVAQRHAIFTAGTKAGASPTDIKKMTDQIKNMSNKDLETLNRDILTNPDFIKGLSPSQLSHLVGEKNEKLSEKDKDKIKEGKLGRVREILTKIRSGTTATSDDKAFIKGLSIKEIELDPSLLEEQEFVDLITGGQLEAVQKSDALTSAQKTDIKNKRESVLRTGDLAAVKNKLDNLKSEDIAKLPSDILERSEVIYNLDSADLAAMQDKITGNTRRKIAEEIRTTMRRTKAWDYIENGPSKHIWA